MIIWEDDFQNRIGRVYKMFPSLHRSYLCLDGNWDFAVDSEDKGIDEKWFSSGKRFKKKIKVPGCWNAQGIGGKGVGQMWFGVREGPIIKGKYYGPAWYRKDFILPEQWQGKRIFLTFGGVKPNLYLWINGNPIASRSTNGTPLRFDITEFVTYGNRNSVLVRIDNRGAHTAMFSHLDHYTHWGGIYNSVVLTAASDVYIDNVKAVPDIETSRVFLLVKISNLNSQEQKISLEASVIFSKGKRVNSKIIGLTINPGQTLEQKIPVGIKKVHLWSVNEPNLYQFEVRLKKNGKTIDFSSERFGMRQIEIEGNKVLFNKDPFYVRGIHINWFFYATLSPNIDIGFWRQYLKKIKNYGFNYIRSCWILPEEFLCAADEIGILIQQSLDYVSPRLRCCEKQYLERQMREVIDLSFNHPSAVLYELANECLEGSDVYTYLYNLCKKLDPTRLAVDSDGVRETSPHRKTYDIRFQHLGAPTWIIYMEQVIKKFSYYKLSPVVLHEYLNIPTLPNIIATQKLYTGAMLPPLHLQKFAAWLKENKLINKYSEYLRASFVHHSRHVKEGMEIALRNSMVQGYSQCAWSDLEVVGIYWGILDAFLQPKGVSVKFNRAYNREQVLLVHFPGTKRNRRLQNVFVTTAWNRWKYQKKKDSKDISVYTYYSGETMPVDFYFRRHSGELLPKIKLRWRLKKENRIIVKGDVADILDKKYALTRFPRITIELPSLKQAEQLTLEADVDGGKKKITNSWDIWVFPNVDILFNHSARLYVDENICQRFKEIFPKEKVTSILRDAKVAIVGTLENACKSLSFGIPAILIEVDAFPWVRTQFWPGWCHPGDLSQGAIIENHPALDSFPHKGEASWPFRYLLERGISLCEESTRIFSPIISGIVNVENHRLVGHLCETKVNDTIFVITGMNLLQDRPEARYLLTCLVEYAYKDKSDNSRNHRLDELKKYAVAGRLIK